MNPVTTYLVTRVVLLRAAVTEWIEARSTPTQEEGSHTTDVILWAVGVVVIVGIALAAITAFVTNESGKLG